MSVNEMSKVEEKWTIEKLDGTNWMTWKFRMQHLLLRKGPHGLVDGSEVLANGANAQATIEHNKSLQKALMTIVMAVGTSQLYLINN